MPEQIDYAHEIVKWADFALRSYAPTLTQTDRDNFLMSLKSQSQWAIREAVQEVSSSDEG